MRFWKVGSLTGGILLISIGVLWLLQSFLPLPFDKLLLYSWPIICILLGAELIFFHIRSKEQKLSVHWFSIILLVVVGILSFGFNAGKVAMETIGFSFQTFTHHINESMTISEKVNEVIITVPDENVYIAGTETKQITVDGLLSANAASKEDLKEKIDNHFSIIQVGTKVYIEMTKSDFELNNITKIKGRLDITIPKNTDIEIKNAESIRIQNMKGFINLPSTQGNIAIEDFLGILQANSNNGNIVITNSSLLPSSKLDTGNGNITLNITSNHSSFFDAYTDTGQILGNVGWKGAEQLSGDRRKHATAQLGTNNQTVMLSTYDGDIVVNN